jgi:hypothetical protein
MSEQYLNFNTNHYDYEHNHFNEQDYAFDRRLQEEEEEFFSMSIELNYCIGE